MAKYISQCIEFNAGDNANHKIDEALAPVLEHMALRYKLHISRGEKLIYPSSIKVDIVVHGWDVEVVLTEVMHGQLVDGERAEGSGEAGEAA